MLKLLLNNPFFNAVKNILTVLDHDQKRRSVYMIGLMLINALFDVLGLATILVLIRSALEGETISSPTYIQTADISTIEHYFNLGLRQIYQWIGATSEIEMLFFLSIVIFITFVVKNAVSLWIVYIQTRFSYNIALRLNKKMFKRFYDEGYLFLTDQTSGKKVYNIVDIPMRFASHYLNPTFYFATELTVILILVVALLLYNPLAVLMLMVIVIPVFLIIYQFSKDRTKMIGEIRNQLMPLNYAKVIESMKAFVDVKLSNIENHYLLQYETSQKKLNRVDVLNRGIYEKIHQKTNDIIFGLGILVIFAFAYFTGASKDSVLTLLGFFAVAAYKVLPSINRMMNSILLIKNSSFTIKELSVVANQSLEPFEDVDRMPFDKSVDLKNITFTYPESDKAALSDVSLSIQKGESVGIIGGSGSGKTTLLKLFLRLIKPQSGSFEIDGSAIDSLSDDASFQRNIGYVEQDVFIMNGTLSENIALGFEQIDDQLLQQVLDESMLSAFVSQQSEGLDMQLGEGGVKLSGGQKQRVGIARALYKKSEILVFDEVTSALDPITERAIVQSINHLASLGKTILIVAHRITTLEKCDRILELVDGKLVGERGYDELIKELVLHE